jgi:hypothetical protein
MMRRIALLTMLVLGFAVCAAFPAAAQQSPLESLRQLGLPDDLILDLKELVDERMPPVAHDVEFSPSEPQDGEPVTVTARIFAVGRSRNAPVFEASILYTTDGGATWSRADMTRAPGDDRKWSGQIPGQPAGTDVLFGIKAVSVTDELYVEAACEQSGFTPMPEGPPAACEGDISPALCALRFPYDCVFPLSVSEHDAISYEDERIAIAKSLDFQYGHVAFGDGRVRLKARFKGEVTHGTISPPNLQFYVAGWLNPDKATLERGLDAILKQGGAVIFAIPSLFRECTIYQVAGGATLDADATSATCVSDGNTLEVSVPLTAMEPNPSGELEFVFLTLSQASPNMTELKLWDASLFTRVKSVNRGYSVK